MTDTPKWTALPVAVSGEIVAFSIVDDQNRILLNGRRQSTASETKCLMDTATAAPDMFEALTGLAEMLVSHYIFEQLGPKEIAQYEAARAALAKARGEN